MPSGWTERVWSPGPDELRGAEALMHGSVPGFRGLGGAETGVNVCATVAVVVDRSLYPTPSPLGTAARAVLETVLPVVITLTPLAPSRTARDGWPDPVVPVHEFMEAIGCGGGCPSVLAAIEDTGAVGVSLRFGPPARLHVVHPDPDAAALALLCRWTPFTVLWAGVPDGTNDGANGAAEEEQEQEHEPAAAGWAVVAWGDVCAGDDDDDTGAGLCDWVHV